MRVDAVLLMAAGTSAALLVPIQHNGLNRPVLTTVCSHRTQPLQMADPLGMAATAAGSALSGAAILTALAASGAIALWVSQENDIARLRAQRLATEADKGKGVPVNSPAYVRPRPLWREEELRKYDGSASPDGPILLAAEGVVYNVSPARKFYGPGGEYSIMAGRDASRFLAKNSVEEETGEERSVPLNVAERAALSAWTFSFKNKYDTVGKLATPEEAIAMLEAEARDLAYMDKLEEMSQTFNEES